MPDSRGGVTAFPLPRPGYVRSCHTEWQRFCRATHTKAHHIKSRKKLFKESKKYIHQGSRLWSIIDHLDLSSPDLHPESVLPQIFALASVIEENTEHLIGLLPHQTLSDRKHSNDCIIGNLIDFYSLPELSHQQLTFSSNSLPKQLLDGIQHTEFKIKSNTN